METERVVTLQKGEHKWRFTWDRGGMLLLNRQLAALARSDSNFDWFDAALVAHRAADAERRIHKDQNSKQHKDKE